MTEKKEIFKSSVIILLGCIVFSLFYLHKLDQPKSAFKKIDGEIISITKTIENYPGLDSSKFRYIKLDSYEKPFQVFIGKSGGDFEPTLENINSLNIGDSVSVYFEESSKTRNAAVNNLARFIDKGNVPVFIKGDSIKKLIYGLIVFCILLIPGLAYLKYKGKIN